MFSSRSSSSIETSSSANASAVPGGRCLLMALQGELVLLLARDLVSVGEDLGALSERDRPLVGHVGVDHPPAERGRVHGLVGARERLVGLEHHPRRAAHRLHAAGDADLLVPGRDSAARTEGRLMPEPHNRFTVAPGIEVREARQEHRHPRDVAVVLAGLVGVAEVDVVDRLEPVSLGQRPPRWPRRSSGRVPASARRAADGVRTASRMKTSGIQLPQPRELLPRRRLGGPQVVGHGQIPASRLAHLLQRHARVQRLQNQLAVPPQHAKDR